MVKAPDKLEEVCVHPAVPPPDQQVAKCALCMKPLGNECMVTREGKAFCCDAAADQFFASEAHYQEYMAKEKKGSFFGKLVKLIVILAVLAGIAYAVWAFVFNKDSGAIDKFKEGASEITNTVKDAAK